MLINGNQSLKVVQKYTPSLFEGAYKARSFAKRLLLHKLVAKNMETNTSYLVRKFFVVFTRFFIYTHPMFDKKTKLS